MSVAPPLEIKGAKVQAGFGKGVDVSAAIWSSVELHSALNMETKSRGTVQGLHLNPACIGYAERRTAWIRQSSLFVVRARPRVEELDAA